MLASLPPIGAALIEPKRRASAGLRSSLEVPVDYFPAPHVVSSCELPQDRKVARVSGLWQVHGGSLL